MPDGLHEDDDHPSRYSIWADAAQGHALPGREPKIEFTVVGTIGLIVVLAVLVAAGFGVWWFIDAVRNR